MNSYIRSGDSGRPLQDQQEMPMELPQHEADKRLSPPHRFGESDKSLLAKTDAGEEQQSKAHHVEENSRFERAKSNSSDSTFNEHDICDEEFDRTIEISDERNRKRISPDRKDVTTLSPKKTKLLQDEEFPDIGRERKVSESKSVTKDGIDQLVSEVDSSFTCSKTIQTGNTGNIRNVSQMPTPVSPLPSESSQPCTSAEVNQYKIIESSKSPERYLQTTTEPSVTLLEHVPECDEKYPESSKSSCKSPIVSSVEYKRNDCGIDHHSGVSKDLHVLALAKPHLFESSSPRCQSDKIDEQVTGCNDVDGDSETKAAYFTPDRIPSPPEINILLSDNDSTDYSSSDSSTDSSTDSSSDSSSDSSFGATENYPIFELEKKESTSEWGLNSPESSTSSSESYKAFEDETGLKVTEQIKDLKNNETTKKLASSQLSTSAFDSYTVLRDFDPVAEIQKRRIGEDENSETEEFSKKLGTDAIASLSEAREDLMCMICDRILSDAHVTDLHDHVMTHFNALNREPEDGEQWFFNPSYCKPPKTFKSS